MFGNDLVLSTSCRQVDVDAVYQVFLENEAKVATVSTASQ